MAYAQVEPFGNDQHLRDEHFARLMALHAEAYRNQKKRGKPYKSDEFLLLKVEERQVIKSPTEIYSVFKTWAILSKGNTP